MVPKRPDISQARKENPGPGAYTPIVNQTKTREARFSIGTSKRDSLVQSSAAPGPGSYDIRGKKQGPQWG